MFTEKFSNSFYTYRKKDPWLFYEQFFHMLLTNYNLLFTITINNFSDSDDNKMKLKKN